MTAPVGRAGAKLAADTATGPWCVFAVAAPGLEGVVEREVRALPGVDGGQVRRLVGGVEWTGSWQTVAHANLWLRAATRVLVRLGVVEARDFAKLRRGLAKLPWGRFVHPGAPVEVSASQSRSRLYHTGALDENVVAAVEDAVGKGAPGQGVAPLKIVLRGEDDRFTASVDSSGELLHRRGWRTEAGAAPLRETLAAGLLLLCDWNGSTPLVDPMCGSGTLAIEAAALASGLAPGLGRAFAFENWPGAEERHAAWREIRAAAEARRRPTTIAIAGSDRSAEVITIAQRNAERAGLAGAVSFTVAEVDDAIAPPGTGLVVCNPPYGKRLGRRAGADRITRRLADLLRKRFRGWQAGLLLPAPVEIRRLGLPVTEQVKLQNGGLRVELCRLKIP